MGKLIRFGAALRGKPNLVNHVVVVHHRDAGGTLWGVEGRPGGVGWVDISVYGNYPYTSANNLQPKSPSQRLRVAQLAEQLLGTSYDWTAIVAAAMESLRLNILWKRQDLKSGAVPADVICSSFADWIYEEVGLASPGKSDGTRYTTPGDWDEFILEERWK